MARKRKELNISGSNLWYLVGLITSDGNLSKDGRHIDITAKEKNFLQRIKESLILVNKVCKKNKGTPKQAYRIQIANKEFYEFLLSIGLTQNKSLTIGELKVPKEYFIDFLRGCIDGDGSIMAFKHPESKNPQLRIRLCSASIDFLNWIKKENEKFGVIGYIKNGKRAYLLEYAMSDSINLLNKIYYKGFPCSLSRKFLFAKTYLRT